MKKGMSLSVFSLIHLLKSFVTIFVISFKRAMGTKTEIYTIPSMSVFFVFSVL